MQSCGSGSALNLSLSIFDFGLQILLWNADPDSATIPKC
jgi:hypothetical protein